MNDPDELPRHSGERPAGIKDIAQALGVSIGTVDRALHSRPGINPLTRARVLKMALTLGYQPNFAARHLKLNRKLSIWVHLPKEIASFFDVLREGIAEAAAPFHSSIAIQYRTYPRLGENDLALFAEALQEKSNGIILAPGHPAKLKPWIRKAARAHIPVVCVATDAPGTERLCTISTDAAASGALVAELLTKFIHKPAPVLLVTGDLSTVDHAEKVRAFQGYLQTMGSPLRVAATLENHDEPEQAYRQTREALSKYPKLSGVYVSTANSVPVVKALEDSGRLKETTVIITDLFPAMVPLLREGKVAATVYQRPKAQGRIAFQALYQFLVEGKCPPLRHRLPPHLIFKSNLDLFLELLPGDLEGAVSSP